MASCLFLEQDKLILMQGLQSCSSSVWNYCSPLSSWFHLIYISNQMSLFQREHPQQSIYTDSPISHTFNLSSSFALFFFISFITPNIIEYIYLFFIHFFQHNVSFLWVETLSYSFFFFCIPSAMQIRGTNY